MCSLFVSCLVGLNDSLAFGNNELANQIFDDDLWGVSFTDWAPWVYNEHFGWVYLHGNSTPSSYSVWTEDLGWLQSSTDSFPEVQLKNFFNDTGIDSLGIDSIILLDLNQPHHHRFYVYESRYWYSVPKTHYGRFAAVPENEIAELPGFIEHDLVPEDFRGYTHTDIYYPDWPDNKNWSIRTVTRFGNYTLQTENWAAQEVWIYNASDGFFYRSNFYFLSFANIEASHHAGRVKVERDEDLFTFTYENSFNRVTRVEMLSMYIPD